MYKRQDYYQALIASTGQAQVDKEQVKKAARQNMKWHEQLISHFAEIFFPLLPALISGGLILGFRNVIGDLPMSNGQTLAQMYPSLQTIYDFLWLIGEAIFFYLPVGICWSAVKKMGGTPTVSYTHLDVYKRQVLIIGGFLGVVNKTGAIDAGIERVTTRLNGREEWMIPILMALFAAGGTIYGMAEESLPFYTLLVPVMMAARFDPLVAAATVLLLSLIPI